MNILPALVFAGWLSLPLFAEEQPLSGELVFPDGDSLPGLPGGVSEEGFLLWQCPLLVTERSPFYPREIDVIRLRGPRPTSAAETIATITFQTRVDKIFDVMEGELLDFNDEEVKVKTWYAGELTLKRSMLHAVEVATEAPAVISGPGNIDEWELIENPEAWQIEGKNLISSARGSVARELKDLPEKLKLEFDLSFDYSPYLRLFFFADSGSEMRPRNSYSIQIQRNSMNFQKNVDNRSVPLQTDHFGGRHDFREENTTHVEIYIDRQEGKLSLYLDNEQITTAIDLEPAMGNHWWHFSTLYGREQTISNLAIRPWDGVMPKRRDYLDFRQELPVAGEQIELHNGDTIIGKATSIDENGRLKIETEYVPVSVPLERLRSFQVTNQENREEPRLYSQDVRAYFHHGGHVTLRLTDIGSDSITGYSQVFGEATFDLSAFTHIEFNPYEPEFRQRRGLPF